MAERYEIRSKIGQGGVGAVYQAYDTQLKRIVALKRLLPPEESELDETPDELLAKEASLMSALSHPNIIAVYDMGVDEDGAFVVMEYIDGETLDDTVKRAALTQDDFINLAEQCLDGLAAAQNEGLLHRDIKPSNIMVRWLPTGRFQVKIVDFGLAKLSFKPTIQTIDHGDAILGSIYFLAPEQFERRLLDKRTDLYSLGCVLYYALTQRYPFRGDTAAAVMMAHLEHRFTPLVELRPDLSPAIIDWVTRLFSREMEDRPMDANDALVELGEAIRAGGGGDSSDFASPAAPPPAEAGTTGSNPRLQTQGPTRSTGRQLITGPISDKAATGTVTLATGPTSTVHPLGTTTRSSVLPQPEKSSRMLVLVLSGLAALAVILLGASQCGDKGTTASTGGPKSSSSPTATPDKEPLTENLLLQLDASESSTRTSLDGTDPGEIDMPIVEWRSPDPLGTRLISMASLERPTLRRARTSPGISKDARVIHINRNSYLHLEDGVLDKPLGGLSFAMVVRSDRKTGRVLLLEQSKPEFAILACDFADGKAELMAKKGRTRGPTKKVQSEIPARGWVVLAGTFDPGLGSMFLATYDGKGKPVISPIEAMPFRGRFNATFLRLGFRPYANAAEKYPFEGRVARFRFYDRPLSETDLSEVARYLGDTFWEKQ